MKKSQKFFYGCLAFLGGIAIGEIIRIPWWVVLLALIIGTNFIFWKNYFIKNHGRCRDAKHCVFTVTAMMLFLLGIFWNNLSVPKIDEQHISNLNEATINFQAVVTEEPDVRLDKQKLTVEPVDFKGKVLLSTFLYPEYDYGDLLEIKCNLKTPEPIEEFAYDKYLAKDNIYSACYRPYIKVLEKGNGNILIGSILKLKKSIEKKVNRTVAEPQAALVSGILLGSRQGIPNDIKEDFNRTGITHIIAISGFNITIIVVVLLNFFKAISINRKKAIWGIVLGLIFFVVITGMSASVVRAGIMGFVVLLAKHLGRMSKVNNVLILSAVVMCFINPKVLIWDAGFQLSFLSTIGLIYLSPVLLKYMKWLPEKFGLQENLVSTLSAIIFTLPLILFQFGRLSIVAPIVNLLVLPVIPISMLVGFLQVIGALLFEYIGQIIGWFSWVLLGYVLKVVKIFGSLSWASVEIKIEWWLMLILYLVLFLVIIFSKRKRATQV